MKQFVYGVAILGTFLILLGLVRYTERRVRPEPLTAGRAAERSKALKEMREAESKAASEYAWQDKTREIVRLPVERAIELTLTEWKDPAAGRAKLISRVEKATAPAPKAPEKPNVYE
jgi:hypothetical protein